MDLAVGSPVSSLVDEGLGNSSYLVDAGDGRALIVDPPRDLRAVRAEADRRGLRVAWAADTHLHADFLSGVRQLAFEVNATVVAPASENRRFDHHGMDDGDELDLGGLRLQALATPGHTTGHMAYVLRDGARTLGVFTGGSLLVGSAARTDLVDPDRATELAHIQHRSITRLLALPDETAVWPTHGAGSFCSAPPGAARTTTIGRERATNPLLAEDEHAFVSRLLGSLGSYPPYFARLPEINRRGPMVLEGTPQLPRLGVARVRRELAAGAVLVDARPVEAFGAGHVPGALSIPLRPQFATWLGWLVAAGTRLVLVRDPGQDPVELAWQALKIGYDDLAGELDDGMAAWLAAGLAVDRVPVVDAYVAANATAAVLDVRQVGEYAAGHVPGAKHVELGALAEPTAIGEIATGRRLLVMCGHGERAMSAASLLARAGHDVAVFAGGPGDLAAARGIRLAAGE